MPRYTVQYLQNKQFCVCYSLGPNSIFFHFITENIWKFRSFLISNWLVELPVTKEFDSLWQIGLLHRILVLLVLIFVEVGKVVIACTYCPIIVAFNTGSAWKQPVLGNKLLFETTFHAEWGGHH